MRLTIEIDDKSLAEIQRNTGIRKKSPAVSRAIEAYLHDQRRRQFLAKVAGGHTDYGLTNDEVEALASYDPD